jgi:hypothetical protein
MHPPFTMHNRRQFLRDCSVVATLASLAPTAVLARSRAGRKTSPAELVFDQFTEQLDTSFSVRAGPQTARLLLVEASRLPATAANSEDARNERFCLVFRSSAHQALPQDTYSFEHPRLGHRDLFIVPMASTQDTSHAYYEAVFNFPIHPLDIVAQLAQAPQPARRS